MNESSNKVATDPRRHPAHPFHNQFVEERIDIILTELKQRLPLFSIRYLSRVSKRNPMTPLIEIRYQLEGKSVVTTVPISIYEEPIEETIKHTARNVAQDFGGKLFYEPIELPF